jgi:hypothetical protein
MPCFLVDVVPQRHDSMITTTFIYQTCSSCTNVADYTMCIVTASTVFRLYINPLLGTEAQCIPYTVVNHFNDLRSNPQQSQGREPELESPSTTSNMHFKSSARQVSGEFSQWRISTSSWIDLGRGFLLFMCVNCNRLKYL